MCSAPVHTTVCSTSADDLLRSLEIDFEIYGPEVSFPNPKLKRLFSKALGCNNLSSYTRTTFLQSNHPQSPSLSSTTPPPSNFLTCSTSASMADPSTSTLKRPTPEVTDIESKEPDSKRYKYVDETDKGVVKEGGGTQAGEDRAGKKEKKNFKDESRKAAREFHASHKKRRGTRPEGEARVDDGEPKAPRQPKRHCALLIGFCGAGYNGMQMCVLFIETLGLISNVFARMNHIVSRMFEP